eukprot:g10231.t1
MKRCRFEIALNVIIIVKILLFSVHASDDSTPPVVSSVLLSTSILNVADGNAQVTVTWSATDESGVKKSYLYFRHEGTSNHLWCEDTNGISITSATRTSGTAIDGTWSSTCYIPSSSVNGEWKISVYAEDTIGNDKTYNELLYLNIEGGSDDITSPQLKLACVALNTTNNIIKMGWNLTDESGVKKSYLYFRHEGTSNHLWCEDTNGISITSATRTSGTAIDGTWSSTCYIPSSSVNGEWKISVYAEDTIGNDKTYSEVSFVTKSTAGLSRKGPKCRYNFDDTHTTKKEDFGTCSTIWDCNYIYLNYTIVIIVVLLLIVAIAYFVTRRRIRQKVQRRSMKDIPLAAIQNQQNQYQSRNTWVNAEGKSNQPVVGIELAPSKLPSPPLVQAQNTVNPLNGIVTQSTSTNVVLPDVETNNSNTNTNTSHPKHSAKKSSFVPDSNASASFVPDAESNVKDSPVDKSATKTLHGRRESVNVFLTEARLTEYTSQLESLGLQTTLDLTDLTDDDLQNIGMNVLQRRRFHRALDAIRHKQTHDEESSVAEYPPQETEVQIAKEDDIDSLFIKSVGRKKAATYAIALKVKKNPNANTSAEMKELLDATKEFLNAQLDKSIQDSEKLLRMQFGCLFCLYSSALTRTKQMGKARIQMTLSVNEQNPAAVLTNVMTTAKMWSFEELNDMLKRAREVQQTGNLNIAAQLDAAEAARTAELHNPYQVHRA